VPIYTNGANTESNAFSAIVWNKTIKKRLPAQTSVYLTEATAIYDAGKEKRTDWELTDSLSTILAIQHNNINPVIQKIIKQLHDGGGKLRVKWIPGHSGTE
jgi:hypothetical protein